MLEDDRQVKVIESEENWMKPIKYYILHQIEPTSKEETERIVQHSKTYVIVDFELYKCSASLSVLMQCVLREIGKEILEGIHEGIYKNHAASRTLVGKAFRSRFYWPTTVFDADELVKRCQGCQFFARQAHIPTQAL
jgi:hypothetical protein